MKLTTTATMIALAALATSCSTPDKLARKLSGYPEKLAELCAGTFPVHDSVRIVERKRVDTILVGDMMVEYVDTTVCPPSSRPDTLIRVKELKVPGRPYPVEVMCVDTFVIRENTARVASLSGELAAAASQAARLSRRSRSKSWAILALAVATLVLGFFHIRRIGF